MDWPLSGKKIVSSFLFLALLAPETDPDASHRTGVRVVLEPLALLLADLAGRPRTQDSVPTAPRPAWPPATRHAVLSDKGRDSWPKGRRG
jgi:hypothetical protein